MMENEMAAKWAVPAEGLWGFAHCGCHDSWYAWSGATYEAKLARLVGDLTSSGANSFRPHIHWHRVEPMLKERLSRLEDVTDDMVEAYSQGGGGINWELDDLMIDALVKAGIEPHIVVAAGYDFQIPSSDYSGIPAKAIPDRIGRDRYLAHAHLHTRAAVRRYKDRVHIWQYENELNGAAETLLAARWRSGRCWFDRGFLTALAEAISRAVHDEDPTALTSHNFHTDVKLIKGIYDWRMDVARWLPFTDIVGVDTYPNYIIGWPCLGRLVGRKVAAAVDVARSKPVMVLECGYATRPRFRGFSEERQARYVREAIWSSAAAGASGFYYYEICSPEGYPVEGPWSDRFFQSHEPWWGVVRRDDTKRPSWYAYWDATQRAKDVCAGREGAPAKW